jgi:hypothetical protein
LFTEKWGNFYYGYDIQADKNSVSARHWTELLNHYQPDLQAKVTRTVSQWNLIVRDHLRNETALRLTAGSEATQVPIKVCDGLPIPLADALKNYDDIAELLLNEQAFTHVSNGLKIADDQFDKLRQLLPCDFSKTELEKIGSWFDGIIGQLQKFAIKDELRMLNQDTLGAYFFNSPRIEIYWASDRYLRPAL